jgi:hypothetical protein
MSTQSKRSTFLAGDFISQDAVRGVLRRRRRAVPATSTDEVNGLPADPPTRADEAASDARRTTAPLRRWSVAELVARAVAPPSAERMSR